MEQAERGEDWERTSATVMAREEIPVEGREQEIEREGKKEGRKLTSKELYHVNCANLSSPLLSSLSLFHLDLTLI